MSTKPSLKLSFILYIWSKQKWGVAPGIYNKSHAHSVKFRKKKSVNWFSENALFLKDDCCSVSVKTHEIDILQSFSFASQVESDVVTMLISYTSRLLAQNSSKEAKLLSIAQWWWMVASCPTFPPGPWAWRWSGHEAAGRARSPGWGKEVLPLWWCCRSRPRLCCPTWWRRWLPLQHANAVYNLARYKNLKI